MIVASTDAPAVALYLRFGVSHQTTGIGLGARPRPVAPPAVDWRLGERGFRVDPDYTLFLADGPWCELDRYLPFQPCVIL